MKTKIKTIDIQAKEWFDKANGNSYFAGIITINFGMKNSQTIKMPFQYGYGETYLHTAIAILKGMELITTKSQYELKQSGIIIRANLQENCRLRDVKAFVA